MHFNYSAVTKLKCVADFFSFFHQQSDLWTQYHHKSNIQSFPVLWAFISGFHFTRLFDRQIKDQIKNFSPHLQPKCHCVSYQLPPSPNTLSHPKQNLERILRKETKPFITLRYGDMRNVVTCGRSKWSGFQPRVCKYVPGRATESLLMTHTEKFHSKPYRTDVSYMSSLGPREGSGEQAPTPPPKNRGVIYCNINSIAMLSQKKKKRSQEKKSTGSAGASGTIPFETRSSILSSLGCTKTTRRRFICRTDPRIPLPSCSSASPYWLQLPRCAETH